RVVSRGAPPQLCFKIPSPWQLPTKLEIVKKVRQGKGLRRKEEPTAAGAKSALKELCCDRCYPCP
ncbi:MAG: hypothetical protein U1B30_04675, partial [Pseudomonadota bacterium]|nr:hypothetical protein [Pseudomonadota bacterium]